VAAVAGGDLPTVVRLAASMTALQFSIGALNDVVDVRADAGRADKPVAAGVVGRGVALTVAGSAAVTGLALAAPSGPATVAIALAGLVIGFAYDLRLRGTAWSWLPFAVGIPLLPLYGWLGAAGSLPTWFAGLLPMAAIAGSAIAIANARADLARDTPAGTVTVATALGEPRARWVGAAAWLLVATLAMGWLLAVGASAGPLAGVAVGLVVIGVGVAMGWRPGRGTRTERSWEVQALGAGIAAVAWVVGVT
jgi:4-hydroxybenzoate polyprenyltransferase